MREGRYIYGIIKTNNFAPGPAKEKSSNEAYPIAYQDIACLVSNSPLQDYSSMLKETLGRFLIKHQVIIEGIMKEHTIIPMKFGTFVSDDEEVIEVLKRGYPQFKELLSTMDDKIELDVTATWNDLNSIIKEIGEKDKEIREFKAEIVTKGNTERSECAKKPPNQAFQDTIKIGMMIKEALDKKKENEQVHMINSLKELTVDFQKHQVMDDKMILNCAFLLEKAKESDFDTALKELDKEYHQRVNFRCVGPLPPYSFATCQMKKVGFSEIDEAKRLLDLGDKVSLKEIKETYREFTQKNHPDKNPDNTLLKEKFEKTTQAYKLLTSCYQGEEITSLDNKQKACIVVEIVRP